ncbi:hypothetical protein [Nodosilinea sp. E11]|uniref:hypothetical protein n=1 Tax=Nodosilinea sp. E11 TaxID=3037479 RepID=UPI0029343080|nr:hypothetical protein [Nodosilinea sp. E11]WOD40424.1 hypothetical protein RRF56_06410 [Nodosilinea sp. E11]
MSWKKWTAKIFAASQKLKALPQPIQLILMLILGMFILALRNLDPLLNPVIYAEDGAWTAIAMTNGWDYVFLHARSDYFVWGNILFLWLASTSSSLFCGNELSCLPVTVTLWSYFFFSIVALLAWWATAGVLPLRFRWALFFLAIFLPLGNTANEVIGRIVNIGYLFVFLALLLMVLRIRKKGNRVAIDLSLLVCAATNPVCFLLVPILSLFSLRGFDARQLFVALRNWGKQYALLFLGLGFLIILRIVTAADTASVEVAGSMRFTSLIETALARPLLYPIIFPFYGSLNDVLTVVLTGILGGLFFYLLRTTDKRDPALLLVSMGTVTLSIFLVATVYMRPILTEILGGYLTTFPDRYFMGINILVIFILIALISSRSKTPLSRKVKKVFFSLLIAIHVLSLPWTIELGWPRMRIAVGPDFSGSLCLSTVALQDQPVNEINTVSVPIYPESWTMVVPRDRVLDATQAWNCLKKSEELAKKSEEAFYISDENWSRGIALHWTGFFVPSTEENLREYSPGRFVIFENGDRRKVVRVEANDPYLNIFLEGERLNPEAVGLPTIYSVTDSDVVE